MATAPDGDRDASLLSAAQLLLGRRGIQSARNGGAGERLAALERRARVCELAGVPPAALAGRTHLQAEYWVGQRAASVDRAASTYRPHLRAAATAAITTASAVRAAGGGDASRRPAGPPVAGELLPPGPFNPELASAGVAAAADSKAVVQRPCAWVQLAKSYGDVLQSGRALSSARVTVVAGRKHESKLKGLAQQLFAVQSVVFDALRAARNRSSTSGAGAGSGSGAQSERSMIESMGLLAPDSDSDAYLPGRVLLVIACCVECVGGEEGVYVCGTAAEGLLEMAVALSAALVANHGGPLMTYSELLVLASLLASMVAYYATEEPAIWSLFYSGAGAAAGSACVHGFAAQLTSCAACCRIAQRLAADARCGLPLLGLRPLHSAYGIVATTHVSAATGGEQERVHLAAAAASRAARPRALVCEGGGGNGAEGQQPFLQAAVRAYRMEVSRVAGKVSSLQRKEGAPGQQRAPGKAGRVGTGVTAAPDPGEALYGGALQLQRLQEAQERLPPDILVGLVPDILRWLPDAVLPLCAGAAADGGGTGDGGSGPAVVQSGRLGSVAARMGLARSLLEADRQGRGPRVVACGGEAMLLVATQAAVLGRARMSCGNRLDDCADARSQGVAGSAAASGAGGAAAAGETSSRSEARLRAMREYGAFGLLLGTALDGKHAAAGASASGRARAAAVQLSPVALDNDFSRLAVSVPNMTRRITVRDGMFPERELEEALTLCLRANHVAAIELLDTAALERTLVMLAGFAAARQREGQDLLVVPLGAEEDVHAAARYAGFLVHAACFAELEEDLQQRVRMQLHPDWQQRRQLAMSRAACLLLGLLPRDAPSGAAVPEMLFRQRECGGIMPFEQDLLRKLVLVVFEMDAESPDTPQRELRWAPCMNSTDGGSTRMLRRLHSSSEGVASVMEVNVGSDSDSVD